MDTMQYMVRIAVLVLQRKILVDYKGSKESVMSTPCHGLYPFSIKKILVRNLEFKQF